MEHYYRKRSMYPQWWTNRDAQLPGVQNVLRASIVIVMQTESSGLPAVAIGRVSNIGCDPSVLNDMYKTFTIITEVALRMPNCQMNGGIMVLDTSNCPSWIIRRFTWPPFVKTLVHAFLNSLPVKVKGFININCTPIVLAGLTILKYFLPQKLKQNFHCFGSDLSSIGSVVPLELLPAEYGGSAGPISRHRELFLAKVTSFNEYLLEDNQYGAADV